jgi:hypothetical protein
MTLFQAPSGETVFEVSIVADLRDACRRVLVKALARPADDGSAVV